MPTMPLQETEAMRAAFTALAGLDPDTETSVMLWLSHRLREHRRSQEGSAYKGIAPTEWFFHYADEDETEVHDTREAGIDEAMEVTPDWRIIEVEGRAAVHHEYLVLIPWTDDRELRSFPTRAAAEQCVLQGQAHFAKRENFALRIGDGELDATEGETLIAVPTPDDFAEPLPF